MPPAVPMLKLNIRYCETEAGVETVKINPAIFFPLHLFCLGRQKFHRDCWMKPTAIADKRDLGRNKLKEHIAFMLEQAKNPELSRLLLRG